MKFLKAACLMKIAIVCNVIYAHGDMRFSSESEYKKDER